MAGDGERRERSAAAAGDDLSSGTGSAISSDGLDDSVLRAAAHVSGASLSEVGLHAGGRLDRRQGAIVGGRYRLERELGQGGMGVVWEATHVLTRRRVAIKFVARAHDELRRRFLREARAASAARHPNVVEVLDVFELDDRTPVMVMEFLSGETLRGLLVRQGKLPLEAAASILLPVAAAVGSAHALGIVHRDLKPENIFVQAGLPPAEGVKVLDFGIAKLTARDSEAPQTESLTGTGAALGTRHYMALEQMTAERDIDARADLWALGVILYECLAGFRPVEGANEAQVVKKLMSGGIQRLDGLDLPADVTDLVMRMLAVERGGRPGDTKEVCSVLARCAGAAPPAIDAAPKAGSRPGSEIDTRTPQPVPVTARRPRPTSALMMGLAGTLLVAAGGWQVWLARATASARPAMGGETGLLPSPDSLVAAAPGESRAPLPIASTQPAPTQAPPAASTTGARLVPRTPAGRQVSRPPSSGPSASAAPAPVASATPSADCEPPYEFDATGKKVWKRQCL
jgi:tRNA A-37 threonylcarbamoyl transferase component Bud32